MSKMYKRIETLIKIGIFSTGLMYAVNKIIETTSLSRNLLSSDKGKYYRWSHGSVFYKKTGTGSPILLIHDLEPSSSMFEWNEIVNKLSSDHTVFLLDLPGCGRSSKLPGETYINYLYVRLLKEFINEVIKEKTDVVATGLSGSFVIMASSIHEDIIGKITLVNPLHPDQLALTPDHKSKLINTLFNIPVLGTFLYNIEYSTQQIEYIFTEKLFYNPFTVTSKMVHTYYEAAHIHNSKGKNLLASIKGNYINVNIKRAFSSLNNDIVILFGKSQPNASSISEAYTSLNANVKTILISKTKSLPQMEEPAKFIQYL